jgi:hypothetical protein
MKRTERHHLKENELRTFARHAAETVEARGRETTMILVAVVVVIAARARLLRLARAACRGRPTPARRRDDRRRGAHRPPARPGTPAGGLYFPTERERSQAALIKFQDRRRCLPDDRGRDLRALPGSRDVAGARQLDAGGRGVSAGDRPAGDSFIGRWARLGLAEAQARAGQYDQASTPSRRCRSARTVPLPVDGILMQLGKTYLEAGKRADAQQTFNKLVDEYPESPFTSDARRELETLKKPAV